MNSDLPSAVPVPNITSTPLSNFLPVESRRHFLFVRFCWIGSGFVLILFLILLLIGYLIAMDKIKLANSNLQMSVSSLIFGLPFIPKTPKYLLTSSWLAHQKAGHNSYAVTVSATSKELSDLIGSNNLDLQMKGFTDFTSSADPKIFFTVDNVDNVSRDLRKIDNNWLLTNSYTLLPSPNLTIPEINNVLLTDTTFQDIKVKKDTLNHVATYRLVYQPTLIQLENINRFIARKLNLNESQKIKDLNIVFWLDPNSFLTNQLLVSFNLVSPDHYCPLSQASVAITANLDHPTTP